MRCYRRLLEVRGDQERLLPISYIRLAADLTMPHSTVKKAVTKLWRAHLVDRTRYLTKGVEGWRSSVNLTVHGHETKAGLVVPEATVGWAETAPKWGGYRVKTETKMVLTNAQAGFSEIQPTDLDPQDGPPKISPLKVGVTDPFTYVKGSAPGGRVFPSMQIDPQTVPRKKLGETRLEGDPDELDPVTSTLSAESQRTRFAWVSQLVSAYNTAYREQGVQVFTKVTACLPGKQPKQPFRGKGKRRWFTAPKKVPETEVEFASWDATSSPLRAPSPVPPADPFGPSIVHWRHYTPLLEAARVLADKRIPPLEWARFMVSHVKAARLPVDRLFSAKALGDHKFRSVFRQVSGYGHGDGSVAIAPTQLHLEQLYRRQESGLILQGNGSLLAFPPWYVKLRKDERAQGVPDPMTRFPRIAPVGAR